VIRSAEAKARKREQNRLDAARRRAENPEYYRERDRARQNDKRRAQGRESYRRHADRICAEQRAKYAANPQKFLDAGRKRLENDPTLTRRYKLKQDYGLTMEQFDAMRAAQGGKCAICAEPFSKTPHVDHCHATGKVRSLLCGGCNVGLGRFRDNPENMEAAAQYVRAHRTRITLVKEA
jgi:hypothetical protein